MYRGAWWAIVRHDLATEQACRWLKLPVFRGCCRTDQKFGWKDVWVLWGPLTLRQGRSGKWEREGKAVWLWISTQEVIFLKGLNSIALASETQHFLPDHQEAQPCLGCAALLLCSLACLSYSAASLVSATAGISLLRCLVPNPGLTLTLTLTQALLTALSFLSSNSLTGNGQMGQYDRRWESPDLYYN